MNAPSVAAPALAAPEPPVFGLVEELASLERDVADAYALAITRVSDLRDVDRLGALREEPLACLETLGLVLRGRPGRLASPRRARSAPSFYSQLGACVSDEAIFAVLRQTERARAEVYEQAAREPCSGPRLGGWFAQVASRAVLSADGLAPRTAAYPSNAVTERGDHGLHPLAFRGRSRSTHASPPERSYR